MKRHLAVSVLGIIAWCSLVAFLGCAAAESRHGHVEKSPVDIMEWTVPWEQTRPRDPYVDQDHHVWFVGQQGDYVAMFDPKTDKFRQYPLEAGTGPHNLIVDGKGFVWYAGNRAAHIGKLDPKTGNIIKYMMPNSGASDPHTLVFGDSNEIWFTVQQGNFVGRLAMDSGSVILTPLLTANARPYGIVVDAAHVPWFTEFGSNKLGTIDSRLQSVKEVSLPRPDARPRRLALTSDGAIWYVDYAEGYLGKFNPSTKTVKEWPASGGRDARPYGMTVDDQDRVWYVETGAFPNRLIGFDPNTEEVISITDIKSGGGTVRHMIYHQPTQTIWFGTDANTIARVTVPQS